MSLNTSLHIYRALSTGIGRHFGLVDRERMNSDAAAGDANVTVRSTQKGIACRRVYDNGTKLIERSTFNSEMNLMNTPGHLTIISREDMHHLRVCDEDLVIAATSDTKVSGS